MLAHPRGYLADVPWSFLAHKDTRDPAQRNCKEQDQLRLVEPGYEERLLHCDACRVETRFHGDEHVGFGQGRMQPWTRDDLVSPGEITEEGDNAPAQVLALNDARVYAPVAESVLVIPPESRIRKGTVVDLLYRNSDDRNRIDKARMPLARKGIIREMATKYRCTPGDIEDALTDLDRGYPLYGENLSPRAVTGK